MLRKLMHRLCCKLICATTAKEKPEWRIFELASTSRALERIIGRGLEISTVVDVGASNGSWTEICMRYLPSARYVLIEAQSGHAAALETFCRNHPNAQHILAAAGNEDGFCYFDDADLFGGLAANKVTENCNVKLPMMQLDTIVKEKRLAGPFLVKLDTHGFELQIIQGAEKVLQNTELAVIETYLFRLNDSALLCHELCAEMDKRGFQLVDFSEPMWRDKDLALWQWDFFFVKKSNPVFLCNSYT